MFLAMTDLGSAWEDLADEAEEAANTPARDWVSVGGMGE